MPAANDNWAAAAVVEIPANGATFTSPPVSISDNTMEAGEVTPTTWAIGNSTLWWKYTPTESGTATFDTGPTVGTPSTDTEMAVYTGSSLATLTKIASGNDAGPGNRAVLTGVAVTGGVTHYIQIGMYQGGSGDIVLAVTGPATAATNRVMTLGRVVSGHVARSLAQPTVFGTVPWIQAGGSPVLEQGEKWLYYAGGRQGSFVAWWDGDEYFFVQLVGWYDGIRVVPAEALGWWDGEMVRPFYERDGGITYDELRTLGLTWDDLKTLGKTWDEQKAWMPIW